MKVAGAWSAFCLVGSSGSILDDLGVYSINDRCGFYQKVEGTVEVSSLGRIGKYEIAYALARGGMAGIYVGVLSGPAGFQKLMAIKVIHPHLIKEKEFARMFLDEARLAAMIQHPNVAQVHTAGDEDGQLYMAVELIIGQDVRTLSRKMSDMGAHLSQYLAAHIVARVCRGLHAAHELRDSRGEPLGLVHRDVSLKNILISYDGQVKLIDFGVAWAKERLSKTGTGVVKGKAAYMAPEQIRGERLDRRADVFSAGVVLYQLLTGSHPFPATNDSEQMRKIVSAPLERLDTTAGKLDLELVRIVEKALSKDPRGRFADAARMGDRLEEVCRRAKVKGPDRQLEQLMGELFSKERELHEARMRAFCEDRGGGSDAAVFVGDGSSSELTCVTSPSKSIWKESRVRRKGWVVALFVAAAAGVVGLYASKYEGPHRGGAEGESLRETAARPAAVGEREGHREVDAPAKEPENHSPSNAGDFEEWIPGEAEVVFEVTPPDAAVSLDGVPIDAGERIALPVDETEHLVVVRAPGYRESRRHFRVEVKTHIKINLVPLVEGMEAEGSMIKNKSFLDAQKNKRSNLLGNPYR